SGAWEPPCSGLLDPAAIGLLLPIGEDVADAERPPGATRLLHGVGVVAREDIDEAVVAPGGPGHGAIDEEAHVGAVGIGVVGGDEDRLGAVIVPAAGAGMGEEAVVAVGPEQAVERVG